MFVPSQRASEPGLPTWPSACADQPGEHRVGAGLQAQVISVEGAPARIVCGNAAQAAAATGGI